MTQSSLRLLACSVALLSASTLCGQDVTKPLRIVSIRATGVQDLVKQWPTTRIGKLMADLDVAEARDKVLNSADSFITRRRKVLARFQQLDLTEGMQPYEVSYIYTAGQSDVWQMFRFPVAQTESAAFEVIAPKPGMTMDTRFVTRLSCSPRYEGRWTQAFEKEAKDLRDSQFFIETKGAKVDGFPAYHFKAKDAEEADQYISAESMRRWMLHMPGSFVYGAGDSPDYKPNDHPRVTDPEIALEIDFANLLKVRGGVGRVQNEMEVIGFHTVQKLKWSAHFVGELIQDQLAVELSGEPDGLIGSLMTGTAKLPAQALPKGAIAQLRAALNLEMLAKVLPIFPNSEEIPEGLVEDITKAFDGGIALSCCSPPMGGVIPRVYLTINVADQAALDRLLEQFLTDDVPTKKVKLSGVECTILKIKDIPNGIQPAFCVQDGKLHFAESGRSLRSFLKLQGKDAVAMDVGDAPMPAGKGETLPSLDLRFDEAELYESFYKHWLPIYELSGMANTATIRRRDMPEPDVVAEYLGQSRGVLRKDGNRYSIAVLGTLGGPEVAAAIMTWGPMLSQDMMRDYRTDQLSRRIAISQLEAAHEAIDKFVKREKRRPKNLAELFSAQQLDDNALELPGDDMAETIKLADGRTVKSSFRYYVPGAQFQTMTGEDGPMMFIEIRPHRHDRLVMTKAGKIPNAYGPDSNKPIDQFGKPGSTGSSPDNQR